MLKPLFRWLALFFIFVQLNQEAFAASKNNLEAKTYLCGQYFKSGKYWTIENARKSHLAKFDGNHLFLEAITFDIKDLNRSIVKKRKIELNSKFDLETSSGKVVKGKVATDAPFKNFTKGNSFDEKKEIRGKYKLEKISPNKFIITGTIYQYGSGRQNISIGCLEAPFNEINTLSIGDFEICRRWEHEGLSAPWNKNLQNHIRDRKINCALGLYEETSNKPAKLHKAEVNNLKGTSDELVCEFATTSKRIGDKTLVSWLKGEQGLAFVKEAKNRGLFCGVTNKTESDQIANSLNNMPTTKSKTLKISNNNPLFEYKKTCEEIGFTPKTPEFGNCVLELKKRSQPNNEQIAAQRLASEIEAASKKMEDIQRRAEEQQRLAERARQKQIDDERRRRAGQALMQFGLGLATGQQQLNNFGQGTVGGNGLVGHGMVSFLKSNYISGLNRICTYGGGGGTKVLTVGAAELCPLQY